MTTHRLMRQPFALALAGLLVIVSLSATASKTRDLNTHQHDFIAFLVPKINSINRAITQQRKKLITLHNSVLPHKTLSRRDQKWLLDLAKSYKVKNSNFTQSKTWETLMRRVDIIPVSLTLAQTANESAWGTSRFVKEGNNYFGQWCHSPGCGLVPRQRNPGSTHEVQKFSNAKDSVHHYINNLNTNSAYTQLRAIRFQARLKGNSLNSVTLAKGLNHYSQRGQAYVSSIQALINHYGLQQYDKTKTPQLTSQIVLKFFLFSRLKA